MPGLGRCGPYELLEWVAAGGMGEIFLATGPRPDGTIGPAAVKRLLPQAARDPVFVGMFIDEATIARRLDHPNVARVWELGREGEAYFLAMEWIDGVSLELLLRRAAGRGGLPVPIATKIAAEVASALDYAHRLADEKGVHLGVVHRDISPPNIMIGLDGRVRLLDFGLAKARTQLVKTQPGFVKGKFGYLAPEQLAGRVDYRADIFALGLCLYEALTARPLFGHASAAATIAAIRGYREAPSARALRSEVPQPLDEAVMRALAPRPSQRFESAGEMKLYLERSLHESSESVDAARLGRFVHGLFPDHRLVTEGVPPEPPDPRRLAAAVVDEAPASRDGRVHVYAALALVLCVALGGVAAWLLLH